MRTNLPIRRAGLVLALTAALAASNAGAQAPALTPTARPASFDAYYSKLRLASNSGSRLDMYALGGRLLWRPAALDETPSFASRIGIGLFADYAPEQEQGFRLLHTGITTELTPLAAPLFGRITPALGLGAGALSTKLDRTRLAGTTRFPLANHNTTDFALTPTVGANVALWRGLDLRADARDVMTFRGPPLHNWQFSAGVTLPF